MAPCDNKASSQREFASVELKVVIAIIGILTSMLLTVIEQLRDAAKRFQCTNGISQISFAVHNYESAQRQFPLGQQLLKQVFL